MQCLQAGSHQASLRELSEQRDEGQWLAEARAGASRSLQGPGLGRWAECCRPGAWFWVERPSQVGPAAEGTGSEERHLSPRPRWHLGLGARLWGEATSCSCRERAGFFTCPRSISITGQGGGEHARLHSHELFPWDWEIAVSPKCPQETRPQDAVSRVPCKRSRFPSGLSRVFLDLSTWNHLHQL